MPSKDALLFDPESMAAHELAMLKLSYERQEDEVIIHDIALLREQFGLQEAQAVQAQALYQDFLNTYYTMVYTPDAGSRQTQYMTCIQLLARYHQFLRQVTGLNYDIQVVMLAEFEMYKDYVEGNIPGMLVAAEAYFTEIYGLKSQVLDEVMQAREPALTILLGLHKAQPTEATWAAIKTSLLTYYTTLYQVIASAFGS